MAKHDVSYERAIAKLLTDTLEQDIPSDTDVWASVQQRMSQRNTAASFPAEVLERLPRSKPGNPLPPAITSDAPRRWTNLGRSYLRTAAGLVSFALLALLTMTVISRLAQGPLVNIVSIPTTLSDILFTIPVNQANIHWAAETWPGTEGFAAAPDGTFYISDADRRLLHYSRTGALLDIRSYADSLKVPLFLTMQGSDLWLFTQVRDATDSQRIVTGFNRVSKEGKDLGGYTWNPSDYPESGGMPAVVSGTQSIPINSGLTSLRIGGDGQFMVEDTPLGSNNVPDYSNSYLVQLVDPNGKADARVLPGFPAAGKYYTTEVQPDFKSGYVSNGDMRVEITSTLYIRALHVFSVRPDGSFYVISEEHFSLPNPNGNDLVHAYLDANYIYHFAADGRQIERARIPGFFIQYIGMIKQLSQDQNGVFYWLEPNYPSEGGGVPATVAIHRINFFPPDRPLPDAETTATPTSITTIVPKVPTTAPTPITETELPDYTVLFSLMVGNPPSGRETFKGNFSMTSDGNLWVNYDSSLQVDRVLRKFGTEGTLLSIIKLPDQIKKMVDLNAEGDHIWVLDVDAVYELGVDGSIIATYHPTLPADFPRQPEGLNQFHLRRGYGGQMLVEDVYTSTYTSVVPVLDPTGNPIQAPFPGYPGNGKYYVKGAQPNQIAVAGKTVTIQVEGDVNGWHIARELPDGSFYVIVNATGSADMAQGQYIYVMHYSSDGKLIERARAAAPGETAGTFQARTQDVQIGPDNRFYAVGSPGLDVQRGLDPGQLRLVRLRFYPASAPMPPVPMQLPSELLTPLPAPIAPTPVPTGDGQQQAATPTRLPDSSPVSLSREGDGFRLDVYTGTVDFSYIDSPWIAPSKLVLRWNPMQGDDYHSPVRYLVDVNSGTMREFSSGRGDIDATANPSGKRVVLVEYTMETRVDIRLYDLETGHEEMVWYPDPGFGQWAPRGLFEPFGTGQPPAHATVKWLNDDTFVLTVRQERDNTVNQPKGDDGGALFLVNVPNKQVSKLSTYGKLLGVSPASDILLREGLLDGNVRLLAPPYQATSQSMETSGKWAVGWSFSPDYSKVAWLEMTPPPGDWSQALPNECCSSDPAPTVNDIAVFDRTSGQITRTAISNYAWSSPEVSWRQSDTLKWSNDSSALFYSAHPAQGQTTLYRLSLAGKSATIAEMDKRIGIEVVAEGSDGSLYYMIIGQDCQNCVQLMRHQPDGTSEVIHANGAPTDWQVDEHGRLEEIKDGGIWLTDLAMARSYEVNFPGVHIDSGQSGWATVGSLVPISPDGNWAAYAGSQSDDVVVGPDGRPTDRGKTVHIARVK